MQYIEYLPEKKSLLILLKLPSIQTIPGIIKAKGIKKKFDYVHYNGIFCCALESY